MNVNLTPDRKDITVEVSGGNGMYYFGSFDRAQKFSINFAFDSLTEAQLRRWKQFCNNPNLEDLIFDELPYKVYTAKITGRPILKYVAFDENGERVYKGEGTLEFTCYHPYAHTPRMSTKRGIWRVVKGEADVGFLDGKTLNNYDELTFVTK
jgi:phage-related protein